MSFRIPKSFELLGHTITVRVVSRRDWSGMVESGAFEAEDEYDFGHWYAESNLILVRRTRSRSLMLHTFFHECAHAWDHYAGTKLSHTNIDVLGGMFAQFIESRKGT